MTRTEENKMILDEMDKRTENAPTRTNDELALLQFFVIATSLIDISKSLAILADKAEGGVENE